MQVLPIAIGMFLLPWYLQMVQAIPTLLNQHNFSYLLFMVRQGLKVILGLLVHRDILDLKEHKVTTVHLEKLDIQVLLVILDLLDLKVYKVTTVHLEKLDIQVLLEIPDLLVRLDLKVIKVQLVIQVHLVIPDILVQPDHKVFREHQDTQVQLV